MHVRNARLIGKCGCDQSSKDRSEQNFGPHTSPIRLTAGRSSHDVANRIKLSSAWCEANYDAWQRIHANSLERLTARLALDTDPKLSSLNKWYRALKGLVSSSKMGAWIMPGRARWRARGSEDGMLKYAIVVEHENDLPAYVHVDPGGHCVINPPPAHFQYSSSELPVAMKALKRDYPTSFIVAHEVNFIDAPALHPPRSPRNRMRAFVQATVRRLRRIA